MRLHEIMSTDVETIPMNASAEEAWNRMRVQGIHHLVVVKENRIVGVISSEDLGGAKGVGIRKGVTAGDLMSASPVSAEPTDTVRQAANKMRGRTVGCLPVLDDGKLVGIVTVTDLVNLLGRGSDRPTTPQRPTLRHHAGPRMQPGGKRRG